MARLNPINLVIISTISCRWNEKIFEKKNKLLIDLLLKSKIITVVIIFCKLFQRLLIQSYLKICSQKNGPFESDKSCNNFCNIVSLDDKKSLRKNKLLIDLLLESKIITVVITWLFQRLLIQSYLKIWKNGPFESDKSCNNFCNIVSLERKNL